MCTRPFKTWLESILSDFSPVFPPWLLGSQWYLGHSMSSLCTHTLSYVCPFPLHLADLVPYCPPHFEAKWVVSPCLWRHLHFSGRGLSYSHCTFVDGCISLNASVYCLGFIFAYCPLSATSLGLWGPCVQQLCVSPITMCLPFHTEPGHKPVFLFKNLKAIFLLKICTSHKWTISQPFRNTHFSSDSCLDLLMDCFYKAFWDHTWKFLFHRKFLLYI